MACRLGELEEMDAEQTAEWERVRENLAAIAREFIDEHGPEQTVSVDSNVLSELDELSTVDTVPAAPPPFPRVRA